MYANPRKGVTRPPTIKREDWVKLSTAARKEVSESLASTTAKPAAPVKVSRNKGGTLQRTSGQVATLLCSLVALLGGQYEDESLDEYDDDDSTRSDDSSDEDEHDDST